MAGLNRPVGEDLGGTPTAVPRDLLECVWPAALDMAKHPFRSRTWLGG